MFDFVEDYFTLENTFDYILSIQVSLDGFSFCITHSKDHSVVAFKSTPLKISSHTLLVRRFKEWYQAEVVLQKHFLKTRLIIFSNKFTLVPDTLQQSKLNEELNHLLFKDGEQLQMAENLIASINAKILFSLPHNFQHTISETIGECSIIHPVKVMLSKKNDLLSENAMLLLFSGKDLYVMLTKNKQLVLSNAFRVNHSNDSVYYVLSIVKQFQVKPSTTQLSYGGKSRYTDESIKALSKLFADVGTLVQRNAISTEKLNESLIQENITLFI